MSAIRVLRLPSVALVVLAALAARADVPPVVSAGSGNLRLSPLQVGAGLLELLQLPTVQRELGLSPRQVARAAELARRYPSLRRRAPLQPNGFERLPSDLQEAQAEIARQIRQELTYRQWSRLNQLRLQSLGVGALFAPEVELALGITRQQRLVAGKIVTRARSHTQTLLAERGVSQEEPDRIPPDLLAKIRRIWDDARQEGYDLLSEQQGLILAELLGAYFEF